MKSALILFYVLVFGLSACSKKGGSSNAHIKPVVGEESSNSPVASTEEKTDLDNTGSKDGGDDYNDFEVEQEKDLADYDYEEESLYDDPDCEGGLKEVNGTLLDCGKKVETTIFATTNCFEDDCKKKQAEEKKNRKIERIVKKEKRKIRRQERKCCEVEKVKTEKVKTPRQKREKEPKVKKDNKEKEERREARRKRREERREKREESKLKIELTKKEKEKKSEEVKISDDTDKIKEKRKIRLKKKDREKLKVKAEEKDKRVKIKVEKKRKLKLRKKEVIEREIYKVEPLPAKDPKIAEPIRDFERPFYEEPRNEEPVTEPLPSPGIDPIDEPSRDLPRVELPRGDKKKRVADLINKYIEGENSKLAEIQLNEIENSVEDVDPILGVCRLESPIVSKEDLFEEDADGNIVVLHNITIENITVLNKDTGKEMSGGKALIYALLEDKKQYIAAMEFYNNSMKKVAETNFVIKYEDNAKAYFESFKILNEMSPKGELKVQKITLDATNDKVTEGFLVLTKKAVHAVVINEVDGASNNTYCLTGGTLKN